MRTRLPRKALSLFLALVMMLSLLPTYALADEEGNVAKIGDVEYATLEEAFDSDAAKNATPESPVTIEIIKAGEYDIPGKFENIKIKGDAGEGEVVAIVKDSLTYGQSAGALNNVTFENLTFKFSVSLYTGFQHSQNVRFCKCKFTGRFNSYGTMLFEDCEFTSPTGDYAMWLYAGDVTFKGCTFYSDGKILNVYNEGNDGGTPWNVTATGCTFNSTKTNKAAFNVKETCGDTALRYNVSISNCTCNENFPAAKEEGGLLVISPLVQVDDRKTGKTGITVTLDGETVYKNGAKVEAKKLPVAAVGTIDRSQKTVSAKLFDGTEETFDFNYEEVEGISNLLPENYPILDLATIGLNWSAISQAQSNSLFSLIPEGEFVFMADPKEEKNDYDDWYADFVVSFDKPVAKNSMGLVGCYFGYNLGFFAPMSVVASTPMPLLASVIGAPWTYANIRKNVGTFLCGAFNTSDDNIGTIMTVDLRIFAQDCEMTDPSSWVEGENTFLITSVPYTFGGSQKIEVEGKEYTYAGTAEAGSAIPKGNYYVNYQKMAKSDGTENVRDDTAYYKVKSVFVDDNEVVVTTEQTSSFAEEATIPSDIKTAVEKNTSVTGVALTTEAEGEQPAGQQAVVDEAVKQVGKEKVKDATDVKIKVDVVVTPDYTPKDSGKVSFKLEPKATVTFLKGNEEVGTAENVEVTNDMISKNQKIKVSVYTGFEPKQLIHETDEGVFIEEFKQGEFSFKDGTATVEIDHFSVLKGNEETELILDTDGFYHIANMDDLNTFRAMVNGGNDFSGKTVVLDNNITFSGDAWTSGIGGEKTFNGTFDGQNHTITDLTITGSSNYIALFGNPWGADISNLTLANPTISNTATDYTGAVCGGGYARVSNVTVTGGSVTGVEQVGGIVGYLSCGSVKNCTVSGTTITATTNRVGGIAGKANVDSQYVISGNTVSGATVKGADSAALVGQIMTGSGKTWQITDNNILNVTVEDENGTGKFNPIGNFRNGCYDADAVTGGHIVRNHWEPATTPDSYTMVNPADGTQYVVIDNFYPVCEIVGGVRYATLAEAAAAAKDNDVVTILADCSSTETLPLDNTITVDLNGKQVTLGATSIAANKKVTIQDNAETKGGLICTGAITVNGTLDISALGYGTTGLIGNQPGSLAITSTGAVALMSAWDSYPAAWLDANSGTFFKDTEDGAEIVTADGVTRFVRVNGKWQVPNAVAQIERTLSGVKYNETYATLAEAVAAAQSGETITLLENATGDGIKIDKSITIDFNGKTYTCTGNPAGSTGTTNQVFQILKNNTVTMKNGTVKVADNVASQFRFIIQNYASLTLNSMVLDGSNLALTGTDRTDTYALCVNSGTVAVNGGELKASTVSGITGFALDSSLNTSYSKPTVTVTGTTLTGDVSLSGGDLALVSGTLTGTLKETWDGVQGATVTKTDSFNATAPEGYFWNNNDQLEKVPDGIVARNTTTGESYATLTEALAAATTGQTVILLKDISNEKFAVVNSGVTLDLNGFNITGAIMIYATGTIKDTAETKGYVQATAYSIIGDNEHLAVYDKAVNGYRFYNATVNSYEKEGEKRFRMNKTVEREAALNMILADMESNGRVKAGVVMKWTEKNETIDKRITFTDDYMRTYAGDSSNKTYRLNFTGLDAISGSVTATAVFYAVDAYNNVIVSIAGDEWVLK